MTEGPTVLVRPSSPPFCTISTCENRQGLCLVGGEGGGTKNHTRWIPSGELGSGELWKSDPRLRRYVRARKRATHIPYLDVGGRRSKSRLPDIQVPPQPHSARGPFPSTSKGGAAHGGVSPPRLPSFGSKAKLAKAKIVRRGYLKNREPPTVCDAQNVLRNDYVRSSL